MRKPLMRISTPAKKIPCIKTTKYIHWKSILLWIVKKRFLGHYFEDWGDRKVNVASNKSLQNHYDMDTNFIILQ